MEAVLSEYFPILVFIAIAIALSLVFIGAAVLIAKQNPDQEKTSAYECVQRGEIPSLTFGRRIVIARRDLEDLVGPLTDTADPLPAP